MPSSESRGRAAPLLAGIAVLAILVTAGLLPNTGAFPASASCPYNNCSTPSTSTATPLWLWAVLGVLVVAALVLAVFLLRRPRSPPSSGPVTAWSGESPEAGAAAVGPEGPAGPEGAPSEGTPGAGAAYLESPEDVGHAPPVVPAAGAAAAGAAAGGEEDIDSLMQELDKISGEILKRGPPEKKPGTTTDSTASDSESPPE